MDCNLIWGLAKLLVILANRTLLKGKTLSLSLFTTLLISNTPASVLQCSVNFDTYCLELVQTLQVEGSVPQDCPPLKMPAKVVGTQVTHNFHLT